MERSEAKRRISNLISTDLRKLATELEVTVFKEGKTNKGWAGHVIERYLGLPLNSSRAPNFGSWELKLVSLKYLKSGRLTAKETMAITMIDEYNIVKTQFEDSHLLNKMRKILIPARIWESQEEKRSILHTVTEFDIDNPEIFNQIKADYDLVRQTIKTKGFSALTGKMGVLIQRSNKRPWTW
jgi:DNA mismatch repair protein MutH